MLRINLLLASLLCYAWASYAQNPIAPGGVAQPITWITTVQQEDSLYLWNKSSNNFISKKTFVNEENTPKLNHHLGYRLTPTEDRSKILLDNNLNLCKLTVFTVYHTTQTKEQVVWSLAIDDSTKMVQSTHRIADLEKRTYLNFQQAKLGRPVIYSYLQNTPACNIPMEEQAISLGHFVNYPSLPVDVFDGVLYEVIVYNRVLTVKERNQVATYLSLKYGISLSLATTQQYSNSKAELIWDNQQKESFHYRVTGIGRDTSANFHQRQATNVAEPQFLTITQSEHKKVVSLPDRSYFLWGDNNKPLKWYSEKNDQNTLLQRTWLVNTVGIDSTFSVDIKLNKTWLSSPISNTHSYWLLIKKKGSEKYDSYPLDKASNKHYLSFSSISWKKYLHTPVQFTIGMALTAPNDSTKWEIPLEMESAESFDFTLFPNPISKGGNFQIHLTNTPKSPTRIKIENIHGQLITSAQLNGINEYGYSLDLPGLYFVTIYNSEISSTKKVVVQ